MIKKFDKPIYVTKPFLPPIETFTEGLKEIWNNQWLTNGGPLLRRYEQTLANYFDIKNIDLTLDGLIFFIKGLEYSWVTEKNILLLEKNLDVVVSLLIDGMKKR